MTPLQFAKQECANYTPAQVQREAEKLGWTLDHCPLNDEYRACFGNFLTPWRNTAPEVLRDLWALKEPKM